MANLSYKKSLLSVAAAAILFSGCSVEPQPISKKEVKEDVAKSLAQIEKVTEPITKPISLDEAINRAINHNLSRKLDILTSALAEQKIDIAAYEALPSLTAKAGYSERDEYAASQSVTFQNGTPGTKSDSYSVSQDKRSVDTGVSFSWNILDFGLSYVRANQQANKYLIAKEKERKSIHNIRQEVRNAYYRAVSADELLKRLKPIMDESRDALKDSKTISSLKIDSPLKALTYQRELLEVIRTLNTLEESLIKSKTELSRLMGLKPGTKFELSEKIKEKYTLPTINTPIDKLEKMALEYRPELQETRYQQKISEEEVKAVMLKMLPGINLSAGYTYDDNQYLLNNEWMSYGASVSWNLLSVFNGALNHKLAKTQIELAKQQKLALSMAVISQVHLSLLDFYEAKKEYELSEDYYGVAKQIYTIIENENALDVNGKLSLIKEKLNYLIASLRISTSYAKVQNAYGKVVSSIGKEKLETAPVALETPKETKPLLAVKKDEEKKESKVETVESKAVETKKSTNITFDETKPTIEITSQAKLVDNAGKTYNVIKTMKPGEKLNYTEVIRSSGRNYWYKIDGIDGDAYIYTDRAKVLPKALAPIVYNETKPTIEITSTAKLVDNAGKKYNVLKTFNAGERLNYTEKVKSEGENYWYKIDGVNQDAYIYVGRAKVVPTASVKEVDFGKEKVETKKEEVKAEVKEVETKVETKKVEAKEETTLTFDETKPTIEILSEAKLVDLPKDGYEVLKVLNPGDKVNYVRKVYTGGNNYWYQIVGKGFIYANRAKVIK